MEKRKLSNGRQAEELETFLWQHTNMTDLELVSEVAECLAEEGYRKQSEGEWVKKYDKAPRYVCSVCNHLFNNKEYKYCPNCGARMRGEKSE
jgi:rubrerythrin